ncbi:30S ribosomal subunit S4 [Xylona heveae TC161]|uniref:Small ribosomal subunit protein uS4m n=1 Tax=Xylona heveae (strain CBS 132557 / TC161) TaxID=1328760 RepID=A0A165HEV6_XYLHT|nr:30S ribosomal subunit S4 [Xylona heveae TC161]KZF23405.1 30S ribosomal subunit S4 [Xylona heveae TC161]
MRKKFHGLKKIKIRQSWNKINLYNIARSRPLSTGHLTFFQQKWAAKAAARAYHGEQIREKQWQRMFSRRLASVVPMDHRYLARFDGSEQAAGRGSGLDPKPDERVRPVARTPYMNMTFAPIERRLDTAIFRALFASSTRQARQMVVHGFVKVNGKKMIYPGYLLNPGDMFQVDPERVMFATGAEKDKTERRESRMLKRSKNSEAGEGEEAGEAAAESATPEQQKPSEQTPKEAKKMINDLMSQAKALLSGSKDQKVSAKRKQDIRAFQRTLKRTLSQSSSSVPTGLTDSLDAQLMELTSKLSISSDAEQPQTPEGSASSEGIFTPEDKAALREAMREMRENPIDPTKPYATPWRPRPFMSAFAFIPPFLEVNQNICSAVYLRHPVARPGFAEVPTPFSYEMSQLAFNWYLRRR